MSKSVAGSSPENPLREEFETEGEAIAFKEGLDAAVELLDNDHLSCDMFVDGDKWVVEYSMVV